MKAPPRRTLPVARLSEHGIGPINGAGLVGRVGTAGRMEMLAIWDRLSDEGRRFVLTMARAKDGEEAPLRRVPEGEA